MNYLLNLTQVRYVFVIIEFVIDFTANYVLKQQLLFSVLWKYELFQLDFSLVQKAIS